MKKKAKPFLAYKKLEDLEERFSTALEPLYRPTASLRQAMGKCQVIDLVAWKRGKL